MTATIAQLEASATTAMASNDLAQARSALESLLAREPEHTKSLLLLSRLEIAALKPAAALQHLHKLLARQPDNPRAIFLTARALNQTGDYKAAEQHLLRLPGSSARDENVLTELGISYLGQSNYDNAEDTFSSVLEDNSRNRDALFQFANLLKRTDRHAQAMDLYKTCIQHHPEFTPAYNALAMLTGARGAPEQALKLLEKALEYAPGRPRTLFNLGKVYIDLQLFAEAEDCFNELLEKCPRFAPGHFQLANTLLQQGKLEQSLQHYEATLALDPDREDAATGKASVLHLMGRNAEAFHSVTECIGTERNNIPAIALFSTLSTDFNCEDKALNLLEDALTQKDMRPAEKSRLHFSMGELLERRCNFEHAFGHFVEANALKRSPRAFKQDISRLKAVKKVFSAEFMASAPRAQDTSPRPVFIVGMPRSGTSLVEQIIATHPEVYGGGELMTLNVLCSRIPKLCDSEQAYPLCAPLLQQQHVDQLSSDYCNHLSALSSGYGTVTDKMPHNFIHAGLIELLFPRARIIHCTRNPVATCVSCFTHDFGSAHAYSYDMAYLGNYYQHYWSLMTHWKSILSIPILDVPYEALVENPEEIIRDMLSFCELHWHDGCLEFHANPRTVATASHAQVRQPFYTSSISKWRRYEPFITPLLENLPDDLKRKQ